MKKQSSDKGKPKYKCQQQYENKLKKNYRNMLLNMGKMIIAYTNKTN